MLLLTGGTSFVGRAVIRKLADYDYAVRILLEPERSSPQLPRGVPVDVALAGGLDRRGVRAALVGVEQVIHLAELGFHRLQPDALAYEVEATRTLVEAAADAGVKRLFYLSTLGAERTSAFSFFASRGLAEEIISGSDLRYTILRSAIPYGKDDDFTCPLAWLMRRTPFFFPIPGDGSVKLQPIWVEDLATSIVWALEDEGTIRRTLEIGGPEYFSFEEIAAMVMRAAGIARANVHARPPYLRAAAWLLQRIAPGAPVSPVWLDYLASSRTTDLDSVPRLLGLNPSRMETKLDYLREGRMSGIRKMEGGV